MSGPHDRVKQLLLEMQRCLTELTLHDIEEMTAHDSEPNWKLAAFGEARGILSKIVRDNYRLFGLKGLEMLEGLEISMRNFHQNAEWGELGASEPIQYIDKMIAVLCDGGEVGAAPGGIPEAGLQYEMPSGVLADDITRAVNQAYQEAVTCFRNQCWLAAIGLSGRVIETVLTDVYKRIVAEDPDAKQMGFNAIVNRLKKSEYQFNKDALETKMQLIHAYRNKAVHGGVLYPSRDEALAVVLLTRDVMTKTVERSRSQPS